jgi:hypothetical protein
VEGVPVPYDRRHAAAVSAFIRMPWQEKSLQPTHAQPTRKDTP